MHLEHGLDTGFVDDVAHSDELCALNRHLDGELRRVHIEGHVGLLFTLDHDLVELGDRDSTMVRVDEGFSDDELHVGIPDLEFGYSREPRAESRTLSLPAIGATCCRAAGRTISFVAEQ